MKFIYLAIVFLFSCVAFAQKPCDFSVNVNDSIGQYKSTKDYLMYEKNFAGSSSYIFYSIIINDGLPMLNVQFLEKSDGFIKTKCFDANSKLYLQLDNGKIVTLLHIAEENCGVMVRDEKGLNNRVLTGYFLFKKDDSDYLKTAPVNLIRIKFGAETNDYIVKKDLSAEIDGKSYTPANYFLDYFHCINESN